MFFASSKMVAKRNSVEFKIIELNWCPWDQVISPWDQVTKSSPSFKKSLGGTKEGTSFASFAEEGLKGPGI